MHTNDAGDRRRHAAVRRRHAALLRPAQDPGAARRARATGSFDAAFGGARRDEERSRAKERIFSLRDPQGQWDPKRQRPELWHLLNGRLSPGESIRVFPLSNWTELDVWQYIHVENIPIVPLYFAQGARGHRARQLADRCSSSRSCRCCPARTAAAGDVPHALARLLARAPARSAPTPTRSPKIIDELVAVRQSERQLRVIDHDQDGSMEVKKREGYF